MNKSALPFIPFSPDSNRNKSIISYDISESEASKSKTIDSLLPKKLVPKFELTAPIGPEPIKDFIPSSSKKIKEKRKAETVKVTSTKSELKEKKIEAPITPIANILKLDKDTVIKDTISKAIEVPKTQKILLKSAHNSRHYTESIFKGNMLQAHEVKPQIKNHENNDWITSVLLVVVGIICILNVSYRSRLRQLFNAFVSNRFVGQIVREENVMFQRISIFLSLLFLFVTSLFIFQIGRYFKMPISSNSSFINYSVIVVVLFVFYFIKISTFNLLGFLLKIEKEMKEYVFTIFLYNHFVGIGLIPVVVLLAFVPGIASKGIFIAGTVFFVATFLLRTIRSYGNVSGSSRFSIFYLFLYLCTLEILPLVVITKLIINIV